MYSVFDPRALSRGRKLLPRISPFSVGSSRGLLCSNANSSPPQGGAADCRLATQVEKQFVRYAFATSRQSSRLENPNLCDLRGRLDPRPPPSQKNREDSGVNPPFFSRGEFCVETPRRVAKCHCCLRNSTSHGLRHDVNFEFFINLSARTNIQGLFGRSKAKNGKITFFIVYFRLFWARRNLFMLFCVLLCGVVLFFETTVLWATRKSTALGAADSRITVENCIS